jgi:hypothetical protein
MMDIRCPSHTLQIFSKCFMLIGWGGGVFNILLPEAVGFKFRVGFLQLFPMCSHQVLTMFPSTSQCVPNSALLSHICIAHRCPLGNFFYSWANIVTCMYRFEANIGESTKFLFYFIFLQWANQRGLMVVS